MPVRSLPRRRVAYAVRWRDVVHQKHIESNARAELFITVTLAKVVQDLLCTIKIHKIHACTKVLVRVVAWCGPGIALPEIDRIILWHAPDITWCMEHKYVLICLTYWRFCENRD